MSEKIVSIPAELNEQEAWDLAQLLKRLTFSEVRTCAVDEAEAYRMISATEKLRKALAEVGFSPR